MTFTRLLALLLALAAASPAMADDSGVVFAGGTAGDGVSGYGGAVVALPGARLGDGLALRGGVNGGTYHYHTNGTRIDADYVGGEVALVYQTSGDWGWANFSMGGRVTDTRLKPIDPGNKLRGTRYDLGLQTDGQAGRDWKLRWFGSLGAFDGAYILQAALGKTLDADRQTVAGIEAGLQGDPRYRTGSEGLFVEQALGMGWQGRLSGGVSEQAGRSAKPYASLGLSHVF